MHSYRVNKLVKVCRHETIAPIIIHVRKFYLYNKNQMYSVVKLLPSIIYSTLLYMYANYTKDISELIDFKINNKHD